MKTYGVEEKLHAFLTSALDGGEWSSSRSGRCKPGATHPGTHWIEDWVGPRAGLGAAAKKNPIIAPAGNWTRIVQPVAQSLHWLSYPGIASFSKS
jgi:hypothetical protein